MMEVARTSEMLVDIQLKTGQYIPQDSGLQYGNGGHPLPLQKMEPHLSSF
jgi:hypothetical protein